MGYIAHRSMKYANESEIMGYIEYRIIGDIYIYIYFFFFFAWGKNLRKFGTIVKLMSNPLLFSWYC